MGVLGINCLDRWRLRYALERNEAEIRGSMRIPGRGCLYAGGGVVGRAHVLAHGTCALVSWQLAVGSARRACSSLVPVGHLGSATLAGLFRCYVLLVLVESWCCNTDRSFLVPLRCLVQVTRVGLRGYLVLGRCMPH